jgi:uncharacterized protein
MDQLLLLRGVQLFNHGHYFEAHEVLEDVWRTARADERKFLQGLVQLAVAFHHHSNGNKVGACSLFRKAVQNLETTCSDPPVITTAVVERAQFWYDRLSQNVALPEPPRLQAQ